VALFAAGQNASMSSPFERPVAKPADPVGSPRGHRSYLQRGVRSVLWGVVIAVVLSVLFRQEFWRTLAYSVCISSLCWFFIDGGRAVAVRWVARRARLRGDTGAVPQEWPGVPWMVGVVVIGTLLGSIGGTTIGNVLTGRSFPKPESYDLHGIVSFLMISLIPATIITYIFYSREVLVAERQKLEAAERLAAENRLRLLESQLEPHMLFNTLANLRVLIGLDPLRAQAMLDRLIAFLRSTLSASRVGQQPLAAEFDRVRDYLALIEIRMGPRLQTRLDLPVDLEAAMVPPLLLQPLVENAVKHGLEPHIEGGRIEVSAVGAGKELILTVRDTGAGLSDSVGDGTRFGLDQVRERLTTLYGAAASLDLRAATDDEGGTSAVIRMPRTMESNTT
jgi:hypothetical protein